MKKRGLRHFMLVFYTLKDVSQNNKVKILRQLLGYKERKKGKVYEHEGLLQRLDAQKLGSNVILVPISSFEGIQNFLSRNDVKTEVREVWTK